jgi:hypothetical protein
MTKGTGTRENRELAFEVFRLFGGRGVERMLGRLKWAHDIDISERTLYEWKTEGRWEERLDAEARGAEQVLTVREKMLASVLALIEKHERQFSKEGAIADAQATYAYTNLLRTAMELASKMTRWESTRPEAGSDKSGAARTGDSG